MSLSPLPAPLNLLGARRFSFHPPIRNAGANDWHYRRATWSELMVVNESTGDEAVIPRTLLGEVSRSPDGAARIRLHRELEWKGDGVAVVSCPVIELPVPLAAAVNDSPQTPAAPGRLAPVVSIRLEAPPRKRTGKKIAVTVMLGAVACAVVADVGRQVGLRNRFEAMRLSRSFLRLKATDDYDAVVSKLGRPSHEAFGETNGWAYQTLSYPSRQFLVVLSGPPGRPVFYLGTVDPLGRILHVSEAAGDRNTLDRLHLATHF